MSDTTAEAAATEAEATTEQTGQEGETKATETVDYWKSRSRENERKAKENAAAAKELAEIKESQKSEAEKASDRVTKAEAEVATIPAKVAEALRTHLVSLHGIDAEDAELFLTATEPELLLKQVDRLVGQSGKSRKQNRVPREGSNQTPAEDGMRAFTRQLFQGGE